MPLCHCPWRAKVQSRRVEASAFYGQRLISASRNFLLFYGRTNFAAKSRNSAQRTAKAKLRITVRQQRYAKQRNATQLVRPELQISRSGPVELCRQILGKSRRRRALSFPLKAPWLSTARLPDPVFGVIPDVWTTLFNPVALATKFRQLAILNTVESCPASAKPQGLRVSVIFIA